MAEMQEPLGSCALRQVPQRGVRLATAGKARSLVQLLERVLLREHRALQEPFCGAGVGGAGASG